MQNRFLKSSRANPLVRGHDNARMGVRRKKRKEAKAVQKRLSKQQFSYVPRERDMAASGHGAPPRAFQAPMAPPTITVQRLKPNQDKLLHTALNAVGGLMQVELGTADGRKKAFQKLAQAWRGI